MMQNGAIMSTDNKASFDQPSIKDKSYFPAQEALRFYTDFANPGKEVYSWNEKMPNSIEALFKGKQLFILATPKI